MIVNLDQSIQQLAASLELSQLWDLADWAATGAPDLSDLLNVAMHAGAAGADSSAVHSRGATAARSAHSFGKKHPTATVQVIVLPTDPGGHNVAAMYFLGTSDELWERLREVHRSRGGATSRP